MFVLVRGLFKMFIVFFFLFFFFFFNFCLSFVFYSCFVVFCFYLWFMGVFLLSRVVRGFVVFGVGGVWGWSGGGGINLE